MQVLPHQTQHPHLSQKLLSSKIPLPRVRLVSTQAKNNDDINSILSKYDSAINGGSSSKPAPAPKGGLPAQRAERLSSHAGASTSGALPQSIANVICSPGIAALVAAAWGVFALSWYKPAFVAGLVLPAAGGHWWQYATSAFVHATTAHLLRNLPIMWLAGEIVRAQTGSAISSWVTYIACAVGANISASMWMPAKAKLAGGLLGLGATGGTAGLVIVALALSLRPTLGFLMGAALFGQLALAPLLTLPVPGGPSAAAPLQHKFWGSLPGGIAALTRTLQGAAADPGLAWLGGVLVAAALVVLAARFPDEEAANARA